jgi:hypothetical protein
MGARTDPNANESVVLLPELDARFVAMEESGVRGERDGHH